MQDIIRFEITELVKDINKNDYQDICKKTENLLYCIYRVTSEDLENLSVLYRLIFYAYQQNPLCSYEILSGFLQYGQSEEGIKIKPLIDHLSIEAFDKLIELGGWSILCDCINSLRNNLENYPNEPIFKHIMSCIVKQLYADDHEMENPDHLSDICHYLPREKSYVWGWFAFYIASSYYHPSQENMSSKRMRKYLMLYRKLVTNLRQIVPKDEGIKETETETETETTRLTIVDDSWRDMVAHLSTTDYQWAIDLLNAIMGRVDIKIAHEVVTAAIKVQEQQAEQAEQQEQAEQFQEEDEEINNYLEKVAEKLESLSEESFTLVQSSVDQQSSADQQPVADQQSSATEKKVENTSTGGGGWFSWLGWS
jgi:hypothetical protein